jgi:hypothetical protein
MDRRRGARVSGLLLAIELICCMGIGRDPQSDPRRAAVTCN